MILKPLLKNILLFAIIACGMVFGLWNCDEQDDTQYYTTVSPESIQAAAGAGEYTVAINTNRRWTVTVSGNSTWCTPDKTEGKGSANVIFTFTPNAALTERSATITFYSASVPNKTVEVTQDGAAPTLSVSPSSLSYTAASSSQTFTITSNTAWTYSSSATWCTSGTTTGSGNRTVTLTVPANPTLTERSATITVRAAGLPDQTIAVRQDAALPALSVSPSSLTYAAGGGNKNFAVTSNTTWTATSSATWCTPSTTSGSGNVNITVTTSANPDLVSRAATITLNSNTLTASVTITQDALSGYPFEIDLSGANFTNCYIYEIWDVDHNKKIGELCKEYLHKSGIVRMQTVVAYPMAGTKVDLSKGLVVENGYFIAWNANPSSTAPTDILTSYAAGETVTTTPTVIYLDAGADRMTTYNISAPPAQRFYAQLRPYTLRDQRSGTANNQGEMSEDNTYKVVKIGIQYWMAENLRTTRYRNGDNIPTNIESGTAGSTSAETLSGSGWQEHLGHAGCAVGAYESLGTSGRTRSFDANASSVTAIKAIVGVLYNFCAIVNREIEYKSQILTNLQDMLSPAGWHVPTRTQMEIMRNYVSQVTTTSVVLPELNAAGTGTYGNATGFSIQGDSQRGQTGGWNAQTYIATMDYNHDPAQSNNYNAHRYNCFQMTTSGTATISTLTVSNQSCRIANFVRCLRDD